MSDKHESIETLADYLQMMALLRYEPQVNYDAADNQEHELVTNPDRLFMEKINVLIKKELRIKPSVATKLLFSLYAFNYKDQKMLMRLFKVFESKKNAIPPFKISSVFRVMAHFDIIHYGAKANLEA